MTKHERPTTHTWHVHRLNKVSNTSDCGVALHVSYNLASNEDGAQDFDVRKEGQPVEDLEPDSITKPSNEPAHANWDERL